MTEDTNVPDQTVIFQVKKGHNSKKKNGSHPKFRTLSSMCGSLHCV